MRFLVTVRTSATSSTRALSKRGHSSKKCRTVSRSPHSHPSVTLASNLDLEKFNLHVPKRKRPRIVCCWRVPTKNVLAADTPALSRDKWSKPSWNGVKRIFVAVFPSETDVLLLILMWNGFLCCSISKWNGGKTKNNEMKRWWNGGFCFTRCFTTVALGMSHMFLWNGRIFLCDFSATNVSLCFTPLLMHFDVVHSENFSKFGVAL